MQLVRNATKASQPPMKGRNTDKPVSNQDMVALFDYLEDALDSQDCEHSFHFIEAYLRSNDLNDVGVLPWLRKYGATCDCEILGDFEFNWRQS